MKISREVKTGILAIGAILLFIFGYSYLQGTNLLEENRTFFVKYDNVEGLAKSAPVTINGFVVGKVTDIDFEDTSGRLVVEFNVENDFDFSDKSVVRIYSANIMGGKSLGIFPDYSGSSVKSGDTLSGQIEKGMLDAVTDKLGPLEEKVNTTLSTLDTLLMSFTQVLNPRTQKNLEETLANLNKTSKNFIGISGNLNQLLDGNQEKLNATFTNLDVTTKNFAKISDSLAQINTGEMVREMEETISKLNAIMTSIDNGEGSVGKLLKDDKMYDNLEGASKQLEELLQDMKLNPKRYVHFSLFGKKDKGYTNPEESNQ
ncbi:hypothetical protein SCB49_12689 [unidentified eubacterium SCB49]|nr:hypothetical protein SCB49_12689 [unidentified eubacterium SCB49]